MFFKSLFLDRGEGRGKGGRETSMCGCTRTPPTGDLAHNPGMCPDWESNLRPFGSHASTQSTEPQQPGQIKFLKSKPVSILLRFTVHLRRQIYKQEPQCGMDCNKVSGKSKEDSPKNIREGFTEEVIFGLSPKDCIGVF